MKKVWLALAASMVVALAACGGGGSDDSSNGGESAESGESSTLDISATNFAFDQEEYTVPAGDITINFQSEEGVHGLGIDGTDIDIQKDGSETVNLEAGEYEIYCSIPCGPGHDDMKAVLVVE